jgi:predicted nucleic acid-binding protein
VLSWEDWWGAWLAIRAPLSAPRVIAEDADDDRVLAFALAGQADFIASSDRRLLALGGAYQGIRIATPAESVQLIGR